MFISWPFSSHPTPCLCTALCEQCGNNPCINFWFWSELIKSELRGTIPDQSLYIWDNWRSSWCLQGSWKCSTPELKDVYYLSGSQRGAETAQAADTLCLADHMSGSPAEHLHHITSHQIQIQSCENHHRRTIHGGNTLFRLLWSGKCFRSLMDKTERLRRRFSSHLSAFRLLQIPQ